MPARGGPAPAWLPCVLAHCVSLLRGRYCSAANNLQRVTSMSDLLPTFGLFTLTALFVLLISLQWVS